MAEIHDVTPFVYNLPNNKMVITYKIFGITECPGAMVRLYHRNK